MDRDRLTLQEDDIEKIAVIGLAGRFPGARTLDLFWKNLRDGVESIKHFTNEELETRGIPSEWLKDPNYVKAGTIFEDFDKFDAVFFGYSPKEAENIDPQQRIFLESAWEALENAGYNPENYEGPIGLFAGSNPNDYLEILPAHLDASDSAGAMERLIGNEKDFLCTRVSYKLNLRGPSVTIQTGCSTSLVAVQLACQSLLNYQCNLALAGGVSVNLRHSKGYFYQEDMIPSPDGHCKAFDADAQGTVLSQGVGVVVLKRLSEALSDGDTIHALIKGVAINNDGGLKAGYTAPSIDGQAEVIAMAHALSGVAADTITYVEAHGTGTPLGDPIEVAALTQAFRASTQKKGFCAIGSVKTNIGHADAAAGVAGMIKTILMLKHKQIPPSLHFKRPNPNIDFENSPFYVPTELSEWYDDGLPRRAGVSSFGIGGTNVHAILEQAPPSRVSEKSRPFQLLLISAHTSNALEKMTTNLVNHLNDNPQQNLADFVYTLHTGRKAFNYRRMVVCNDREGAIKSLENPNSELVFNSYQEPVNRNVVFMFSGQGSQYVNMGVELYRTESVFREHIDYCSEILRSHLSLDLRDILYPETEDIEKLAQQLKQTSISQPALFSIEYALAKLWMAWGVHPGAMVGHSIGEYVAACLAGVFSLEDALFLVANRGQLMQQLPAGSMLAVPLSEKDIERFLNRHLSLAVVSAPSYCVVSGEKEAVKELADDLEKNDVAFTPLHTSHAFHSKMMEPILDAFAEQVGQVRIGPPQIPFLSNHTGTWITSDEAMSPIYWARHLRHTVRFSDCVQELMKDSDRIFLEVGPGQTLSTFVRQHSNGLKGRVVLSSIRHPKEKKSDIAFILTTLGRLWLTGVKLDWSGFYKDERRHRIPLPNYPFERQRYWSEPLKPEHEVSDSQARLVKKPDIADWSYVPSWERSILTAVNASMKRVPSNWIVFVDDCGIGSQLIKRLQKDAQSVIAVKPGSRFIKDSDHSYVINPREPDDYNALFKELQVLNKNLGAILHLWGVTKNKVEESRFKFCEEIQNLGLFSLLNIAKAVGGQDITEDIQIDVVTNNMQDITGDDPLYPEKATILGAVKIIPLEHFNISCRSIDIVLPESGSLQEKDLLNRLLVELEVKSPDPIIAYRGTYRWVPIVKPIQLGKSAEQMPPRLKEMGVYLITGGFGGMGFKLAEYLAKSLKARLILVGRADFPKREEWQEWLATHDEWDSVARRISKLQELEESGAEVMVLSADVSNYEQMQNGIALAKRCFGQIDGVLHTAGIADYAGIIQTRSLEITETILAPKVMGTLVLDSILKDTELSFFILFSSIGNMIYKQNFGQVAYSAANEFLDAFAHYKAMANSTFTASINWDNWQEVGMTIGAVERKSAEKRKGLIDYQFAQLMDDLKNGLSPLEGTEVFRRILGSNLSQVIVSTVDLQARIDKHKEPEPSAEEEKDSPQKESVAAPYARPDLLSAYVAPGNPTEEIIAKIWQQLLRVDKVGIHDNFFELGGHSLLASQIVARLRKAFPVKFSVATMIERPTVHALSKMILNENGKPTSFAESKNRGEKRKERRAQRRMVEKTI